LNLPFREITLQELDDGVHLKPRSSNGRGPSSHHLSHLLHTETDASSESTQKLSPDDTETFPPDAADDPLDPIETDSAILAPVVLPCG